MPHTGEKQLPWWRSFGHVFHPARRYSKCGRHATLLLEQLEDRCCPAVTLTVGPNVNVSQMRDIQAEPTIAVNSVNPAKQFMASVNRNKGLAPIGLFASYTTTGGVAGGWTSRDHGHGTCQRGFSSSR
jgi:hypothetical protein